jgi:malate dehydrogenase
MKISIIGAAGTLGSCTAFYLACQGLSDEIVMFDVNKNLLKCHIMDITAAVSGMQDMEIREGKGSEDLAGSDIVVMTASVPYRFVTSRLEFLYDNIKVIQEIAAQIVKFCPEAVVITATNPIDPMNYAMYLCVNSAHEKFIGYSLNDSIRFRMMAAKVLGEKTTEMEGLVIGEHGENHVPLFSTLKTGGQSVTMDEALKKRIRADMANVLSSYENLKTGRTTGWTSAIGISTIIKAISDDTGEVIPCSAVLTGEYGARDISIGVPAVISRVGVEKILEWKLESDEQEEMQKAISLQEDIAGKVKEALKV